jgi:tRNA pseudouridine55 synthase
MLGAFLNLNKPAGITAHGCVARVRKMLNQKKIGHSGTLDPAATGVLPIAIGKATRLLRFLNAGKAYKATVQFGITTNTDDLDGETLTKQACPDLTLAAIEACLPQFIGQIQQYPPAYSAIKIKGKRLYELARAGQEIDIPVRTVEVKSIEVLDWRRGEFPQLELLIDCGTGTYIRSIARDLGEKLGCGATLAQLERTYSNGFSLENSVNFSQLAGILETDGEIEKFLIAPDRALLHLAAVSLGRKSAKRWCQGQAIPVEMVSKHMDIPTSTTAQVTNQPEHDRLVAAIAPSQAKQTAKTAEISETLELTDEVIGTAKLDIQQITQHDQYREPEFSENLEATVINSPINHLGNVRVYTSDPNNHQQMLFLGMGEMRPDFLVPEVVLRKFNFEEIS